jgi:hypothetical protein
MNNISLGEKPKNLENERDRKDLESEKKVLVNMIDRLIENINSITSEEHTYSIKYKFFLLNCMLEDFMKSYLDNTSISTDQNNIIFNYLKGIVYN